MSRRFENGFPGFLRTRACHSATNQTGETAVRALANTLCSASTHRAKLPACRAPACHSTTFGACVVQLLLPGLLFRNLHILLLCMLCTDNHQLHRRRFWYCRHLLTNPSRSHQPGPPSLGRLWTDPLVRYWVPLLKPSLCSRWLVWPNLQYDLVG